MANVLTVVWFVIIYIVTQTSLLVWTNLLLPNPVARARRRLEARPLRCFLSGVLFWLLTVLVAVSLIREGRPGPLQILGWISAGPMLAGSVIGGAAFARLAAERIREQMRVESPMLRTVLGALLTTMAGLVPIIGWVAFFPVVGFMSVGAGMASLFSRREIAPSGSPAREDTPSGTGGFLLSSEPQVG